MTIRELKALLQDYLNKLEKYGGNAEVELYRNTYFIPRGDNFIAIQNKGFVDLDNPLDDESEEDEL